MPPVRAPRASEVLKVADLYRLGELPTERPHPETRDLGHWARTDLPRAVAALKAVDLAALSALEERAAGIDRLAASVRATLAAGRGVYLCGCGATGRLSLSLEFLWRRQRASDRVRSFMAGGDVALVHSLEGFEDSGSFGARHLEQSGFGEGDLLIACTEGGETPYVIGATERAARISSRAPYFLYCNPDADLLRSVERFRRVHENPKIRKLCLYVGPMALTGSTRMQASTVLQLAVGLALFYDGQPAAARTARFRDRIAATDFSFLAGFVEEESGIYEAGDHVLYRTRDYGITVFTDTTERSPTFSLAPFDQLRERKARHSLCYVLLDDTDSAAGAWRRLLHREPRALNWPEVDPRTAPDYLQGFDFSRRAQALRQRLIPDREHHEFHVSGSGGAILLRLGNQRRQVPAQDLPELERHLLLKQMLNIHSTLVMGRLGRYEGNLMTWVTPTNGKLIDRAARYVQHLLARDGRADLGYADVVRQLCAEMERVRPDESVVLRTHASLLRAGRAPTGRTPGAGAASRLSEGPRL